jgi:hypothetical protein
MALLSHDFFCGKFSSSDSRINFCFGYLRHEVSCLQRNISAKSSKNSFSRFYNCLFRQLGISFFFRLIKPIRYFKGKCHRNPNVPQHMGSSSRLFMFTYLKNRLARTENRIDFFNDFSKSSAFEEQNVGRKVLRPVTKQILFG